MNIEALHQLVNATPPYPPEENQLATTTIRQFAQDNGFTYTLLKPQLVAYSLKEYRNTPAWLGLVGLGAGKDAYHVVEGSYEGFSFEMFLMWDTIVNGIVYSNPNEAQREKFTRQQTAGIIRIKLPAIFPQTVLDSSKNDHFQSSVRTEYKSSQRLKLEGDFNNYFDLYAPTGLQVNVLTLLAPNMMQILKTHAGLFDIEFYGSEMILMTRGRLYDPDVMNALSEALTEQLRYIRRLIPSWNYMPSKKPFDLLQKPFITGGVMKMGKYRISSVVQITIVLAGFALFALIIVILNHIFPSSTGN